MIEFIIVGLGGFIGCCLRFGITKLMIPMELPFPVPTLIANVIAGFIVGLVTGLERDSNLISPKTKLFLTTGMMGGLSTFSTFSMETINLFSKGRYLHAAGNVMLNISLSFAGVILGLLTAKFILRKGTI